MLSSMSRTLSRGRAAGRARRSPALHGGSRPPSEEYGRGRPPILPEVLMGDTIWTVSVAFTREGDRTRADAMLELAGDHFHGFGRAKRAPEDPSVPVIGQDLAAARALSDLSTSCSRRPPRASSRMRDTRSRFTAEAYVRGSGAGLGCAPAARGAAPSGRDAERGTERVQIRGAGDDAVAGGEVDEVGGRTPSPRRPGRQAREHAAPSSPADPSSSTGSSPTPRAHLEATTRPCPLSSAPRPNFAPASTSSSR